MIYRNTVNIKKSTSSKIMVRTVRFFHTQKKEDLRDARCSPGRNKLELKSWRNSLFPSSCIPSPQVTFPGSHCFTQVFYLKVVENIE